MIRAGLRQAKKKVLNNASVSAIGSGSRQSRNFSTLNSREFYNHLLDLIREQSSNKEVREKFAEQMYRVYV